MARSRARRSSLNSLFAALFFLTLVITISQAVGSFVVTVTPTSVAPISTATSQPTPAPTPTQIPYSQISGFDNFTTCEGQFIETGTSEGSGVKLTLMKQNHEGGTDLNSKFYLEESDRPDTLLLILYRYSLNDQNPDDLVDYWHHGADKAETYISMGPAWSMEWKDKYLVLYTSDSHMLAFHFNAQSITYSANAKCKK